MAERQIALTSKFWQLCALKGYGAVAVRKLIHDRLQPYKGEAIQHRSTAAWLLASDVDSRHRSTFTYVMNDRPEYKLPNKSTKLIENAETPTKFRLGGREVDPRTILYL